MVDGNVTETVPLDSLDIVLATGYVIGEPLSSISGFVLNNTFYGSVYRTEVIHFLEPWRPFVKVSRGNGRGEGYRALLHSVEGIQAVPKKSPEDPAAPSSEAKSCEMSVVSDAEFFHQVGDGNVRDTLTQMLWFLKVK